ncbi:cohesin subunit IRR1 [Aspergillus aculeatinus CBS 121060]|uniref:Nuclear cohesin complex subunit n=1 Tax=Aspergillus aculeatinus CBS 121060 TaxID=1448322 RepID=A0ACD1H208_9EURO|nr:nuclear cohesin complex subunit [Aspergillus aculeatinus CBS 121060]RAH67635.1 nuclear cohesin complex subunit [Aspergillus aculeatinus CBS 121060]
METESPLSTPQPEPATQSDASPSTDRRKSGRVTRRPELYSQSYSASNGATPSGAKRKRAATGDSNDEGEEGEQSEDHASESDDIESADEEPDEEELREQKRAARKASSKKQTSGSSKSKSNKSQSSRSAKKPKVAAAAGNGIGRQLALRPATNGKRSRPKQMKARLTMAARQGGLYAEIFGKGRNVETVAAEWLTAYQEDQSAAVTELVNMMLRCSGTDLDVDTHDIEDVDNVPTRVGDLAIRYDAVGITEYPLISKSRKLRSFQPVLESFFMALIQTLHHSSVLYTDPNLFENLLVWMAGFSTSRCRPFRHTAVVITMTIMNAFCDLAREITTLVSTSRKQLESERKKKNVNKGRADAIASAIEDNEQKIEVIDDALKDGVDIIFVHRYRDVDPHIRTECMISLGRWIRTYREYFFDGQFLRFFGWILADPVPQARLVVVNQLRDIYGNRDNVAGLRAFNERWRQRLVEMAAHDADITVRASVIELLDIVRETGLIEPADIDTVGKLVFDNEARVRKAAGRFFVANVEDVFDSTLEELGEEVNELFGEEDEDDFESPKRSWIKFKCLVDILQAYDNMESEEHREDPSIPSRDALLGASMETRFVLATEAIYPHLTDLSHWQSLAGYLLYDHSQISDDTAEDDAAASVRQAYKMQEGQEVILLEVLCSAVKLRVLDIAKSDIDKRGRKVKTLTDKIPELQEEIAHSLAQIIPQLLNKFGSVPEAASAVLRLEHLVDLGKIEDIQKDATAYTSLLNDINKQFLTHSDRDVLAEASVAFLHAKSSDDMREALEGKVQELWDNMIDTLCTLSRETEVAEGGSIAPATLNELINTVTRISNLASIIDCTHVLETMPSTRTKGKSKDFAEAPFNTLLHLVERGLRAEEDDEDSAKAETELVVNAIRTLLFYFMWKVHSLVSTLNAGKASFNTAFFEALTKGREMFVAALTAIMKSRSGLDDIRFCAATTLLDLQTLFGTLRHAGLGVGNDEDTIFQTQSLVHEIGDEPKALITKIHGIAERTYAKKIRVSLEPADDDEPLSDDDIQKAPVDEDEEEDEDEDADQPLDDERLRSSIVAEQRLCELTGKIVLAIVGRILDASGSDQGQLRKRLLHHKAKLGRNYREVLAFLGDRKPRTAASRATPAHSRAKQPAAAPARPTTDKPRHGGAASSSGANPTTKQRKESHKSAERIEDDDDDDDDDEEEEEEEEDAIEDDGSEDGEEDLRARGLVEEGNIDLDVDQHQDEDANAASPEPDDEDEVMGD